MHQTEAYFYSVGEISGLKRVFEFDITLCPRCGGRLRVIADMTDPAVIRKILDHIHQRAPPVWRPTPKQYAIS